MTTYSTRGIALGRPRKDGLPPGSVAGPKPDRVVRLGRPKGFKPNPSQRQAHVREVTAAELRDWLQALGLSPAALAYVLGRTPETVGPWLSGDRRIPPYVVCYLELLGAYDAQLRLLAPWEPFRAQVFAWIEAQPGELRPERIAMRMGLPVGMVRQAVYELRREGVLV